MITILPVNERQRYQLAWIIQATDFFIATLCGNTNADKDAGIRRATQTFSGGSSAANAIYQGYNFARKRIKTRSMT